MSTQKINKCWKEIGVYGIPICDKLEIYHHCRHCPVYSEAGRTLLDREIPEELSEEWTKITAEPVKKETKENFSVMIFRIAEEWLAFKTQFFQEVVDSRHIHFVPYRSNNIFLGIVNINGELLLCMSLAEMLGLKAPELKSKQISLQRMLVLKNDSERFVIPVDEIYGVARINSSALQKTPATITKSPLSQTAWLFDFNSRNIGLLTEEKLFEHFRDCI